MTIVMTKNSLGRLLNDVLVEPADDDSSHTARPACSA